MEKKAIDQKEYLKKYLSAKDGDKKKKKKKKLKVGPKTVKIIDDDIDLKNMRPIDDNEFEIFLDSEDAPQIAGIVDEGPSKTHSGAKWKIVADSFDGDLSIKSNEKSNRRDVNGKSSMSTIVNHDNLSPLRNKKHKDKRKKESGSDSDEPESNVHRVKKKKNKAKSKKHGSDSDLSPPRRRKKDSDSDLSPPRRRKKDSDSDLSPPRRRKKDSDSDLSPPRRQKNADDSDLSPPRRRERTVRKDSDSDLSPPRRRQSSKDLYEMPSTSKGITRKMDTDSDVSPPRKMLEVIKNNSDSDLSPPRRQQAVRKDSDSDLSPPRIRKTFDDEHQKSSSTKRQSRKKDYDSDLSPPRRQQAVRKDSDSDLSPPRIRKDFDGKYRKSSPSNNRPRKKNDSDRSPSRRKQQTVRKDSDSDLSPPRIRNNFDDSNRNSSRRNEKSHRRDNERDLSPPRNRKNFDFDHSPPQRGTEYSSSYPKSKYNDRNDHGSRNASRSYRNDRNYYKTDKDYKYSEKNRLIKNSDTDPSPPRKKIREGDRNASPPRRSRDYHKDFQEKSRKERRTNKYDDEPRYRPRSDSKDRFSKHNNGDEDVGSSHSDNMEHRKKMKKTLDGKTAGLQDAKALREETEAFKKREAEQFRKLSKEISGVGQAAIIRDSKTGRKRDLEAEAAAEREKQKRQQELDEKYSKWGKGLKQVEDRQERLKDDLYEMSKPLARYADDADLDKRLRDQDREGDPMLDYIKQKQIKEGKRQPDRPTYEGSFMPNRFGIKPGHRWDGVDRSNGYEKRWFEARNAKLALQEDAYKWSTSDM